MKITLISMDKYITSYGLRIISSVLQKYGCEVKVIFTQTAIGFPLGESVDKDILKISKGSDLIGFSVMSNNFFQARELTTKLRNKYSIPIIWGGIHPTFCPEESLKYADMVCVGEGEKAIVSLVKNIKNHKVQTDTKGIWFKRNGEIIKNPLEQLTMDLDTLPLPDYGPENHYIRDGNKIKPLTKNLFRKYLTRRKVGEGIFEEEYYISTSRGCPFKCAYCASNSIKKLYPGQKFYRLRSPAKIIDEVKGLLRKYNYIKWIYFADDDLFAAPIERIKAFSTLWKKEINLPFYATTSPWSYSDEKMKSFIEAGIGIVDMGIQSVSKRGTVSFNRAAPKRKILSVIKRINVLMKDKYKSSPPLYDFILDNPYENDSDMIENLDFMLKIPQPRRFNLFSLIPFPGSDIYEKMKKDGLIKDEEKTIYNRSYSYPKATYINLLIFLIYLNFPPNIIKTLRSKYLMLFFNNRVFKEIFKIIPYSFFINNAGRLLSFKKLKQSIN